MSLQRAQKRRRDIVTFLGASAAVTLVLIPFTSQLMMIVHLVVDVALLAYLVMLSRARRIAAEREVKLRYLPTGTDVADPTYLLEQLGGRA